MALILVRHTRPVTDGRCYGRTEIDLAATFEAEAEALVRALPAVSAIISSPLRRCRRLADFLGVRLGAPVKVDPDWSEIDFGSWEGNPWDALPRAEIDDWAADFLHARPHGGESVAMLLDRTRGAIARARAEPQPVLAVTHAGPIRAALFAAGDAGAWTYGVPFAEPIALPTSERS